MGGRTCSSEMEANLSSTLCVSSSSALIGAFSPSGVEAMLMLVPAAEKGLNSLMTLRGGEEGAAVGGGGTARE